MGRFAADRTSWWASHRLGESPNVRNEPIPRRFHAMSGSSVSTSPGASVPSAHAYDPGAPDCLPLGADAPTRAYRDAAGVAWTVREVEARGTPGARGDCYLLFRSLMAWRRVWQYPSDWLHLPDAALEALSAQR